MSAASDPAHELLLAISRAAVQGGPADDALDRIASALSERSGVTCRILPVDAADAAAAATGAVQAVPDVVSGPVDLALASPGRSDAAPVALLRLESATTPTPLKAPLAPILPYLSTIVRIVFTSRRAERRAAAAEAVQSLVKAQAAAHPLRTLLVDALVALASVIDAERVQLYDERGKCLLSLLRGGGPAPARDEETSFAASALAAPAGSRRLLPSPADDAGAGAGLSLVPLAALALPAVRVGASTRALVAAFRRGPAFSDDDASVATAIAAEIARVGCDEAAADAAAAVGRAPRDALAAAFAAHVPRHAAPLPSSLRAIPEPPAGVLVRPSHTPAALTWDLDTLSRSPDQLCSLAEEFFDHWDCVRRFAVPRPALHAFIFAVSRNYHDNPYHNWAHVLSVVHFSFMVAQATRMRDVLADVDRFALLVAAVGHDLDHPGHNNDFESKTSSDLALRYNDASVLENHHAALLFSLIRRRSAANGHRDCDIFAGLGEDDYRTARRRIVGAILATDMARHGSIVERIKSTNAADPFPNGGDDSERQFCADVAIHGADLSNPVFPDFDLVKRWAERICTEFHQQTEREEAAGVAVSGWMKGLTSIVPIAKTQMFFTANVVAPMWEALAEVFPAIEPLVVNMHRNRGYWQRVAEGEDIDAVVQDAKRDKERRSAQERA